jgi:hypothetical protein
MIVDPSMFKGLDLDALSAVAPSEDGALFADVAKEAGMVDDASTIAAGLAEGLAIPITVPVTGGSQVSAMHSAVHTP